MLTTLREIAIDQLDAAGAAGYRPAVAYWLDTYTERAADELDGPPFVAPRLAPDTGAVLAELGDDGVLRLLGTEPATEPETVERDDSRPGGPEPATAATAAHSGPSDATPEGEIAVPLGEVGELVGDGEGEGETAEPVERPPADAPDPSPGQREEGTEDGETIADPAAGEPAPPVPMDRADVAALSGEQVARVNRGGARHGRGGRR